MFGTLCYGGTLVLRDRGDPFEHLKRVHATNMTPSVLGALLPEDYKHLDTIGLAGEPVSQSMADTWGVGRNLRNSYGPSEVCLSLSLSFTLFSAVFHVYRNHNLVWLASALFFCKVVYFSWDTDVKPNSAARSQRPLASNQE